MCNFRLLLSYILKVVTVKIHCLNYVFSVLLVIVLASFWGAVGSPVGDLEANRTQRPQRALPGPLKSYQPYSV